MENLIRDVKENQASPQSYDCEINHPTAGWVPTTAAPGDSCAECSLTYELIVVAIKAGEVVPTPYDWATHWEREFNSKKSELKNEASLSNQSYDALTDEQKTELQDYYAALDALAFSGDTEFTAWPEKPEFL